uniref:Uncharacterized protein n=1 Tax=Globodera rostochiensis TaxID=31243 RepID=A0A914H5R2_GLORO
MIFLFDETSSYSIQNPSNFWQNLMQKYGIWDKQMAVEMDESDSFIEKLSMKEPLSPNEFPGLFFNLFKLGNFYELVNAGKSTAVQIELPEIVQSLATIWSEMSRINNGENAKEIVQKIVYLWQLVKQNDKFNEYFGNKSEGKNRRGKRRNRIIFVSSDSGSIMVSLLIIAVLIVALLLCVCWCRRR